MTRRIVSNENVRAALAGTGIDLVASCSAEAYDARAPAQLKSSLLLPGARGVVVVASAGRELWRRVREHLNGAHPVDAYVARALDEVDRALSARGIPFRRFEPTLDAPLPLDFRALGEIVGLGSLGPFG